METRANYALIGLFTLLVIVAGFGFVFWFTGTERSVDRALYRVEFFGSVAGLSKGSPVLFNGIRVGEVASVELSPSAPDQAFAVIQVDRNAPIKADTRASLDVNLLSGVAQVGLLGGARDAPPLAKRDPQDPYPTITADQGGLGSIIQTARGTAEKANVLIDLLTDVVKTNRGDLNTAVSNLRTFTDALASNSTKVDSFLSSVGDAAGRLGPLAGKLETLSDNVNRVVVAIEPDRVRDIVRNVEGVTKTVDENRTYIASVLRDAASLSSRLNDAAPKLDRVLADLGRTLGGVDPAKVSQVIDNAQRFTEGLSASTPDLQGTLRNANSLTAKLNASADRIDSTLKAVQGFLGSASGQEGRGTFEAVRVAAEAFRKASENLDRRATEIAVAVGRFSGVGARTVESLGTDARRAVNNVGRAAQTLERNPSSVIFGSGRPSIPEYSGR